MPDGKDQDLDPRTRASRARGKNSYFRQTTPRRETTSGVRQQHQTTTSPSPNQPTATTSEYDGEGERLHHGGELFADPALQDLLEVWAEAEPFTMLDDQAGMARVLIAAYPRVDLVGESRKIIAWWFANPSKRKTKRGLKRFLNAWFSRASSPGGPRLPSAPRKREVSYSASDLWGDDDA